MMESDLETKTQEAVQIKTSFFDKIRQTYYQLAYSKYEGLNPEEAMQRKATNFFWNIGLMSSLYFAGSYSQSGKTEDLTVALCSGMAALLAGILKVHNAYEDSQKRR